MARIKIVDLPADMKISPEEMKKVFGGAPRTVNMYANPIEAVLMTEDPERLGYGNPLDTLDAKGRKIPVFCDPSALRGINIPPASGENCSAETWGGT